MAKIELDFKDSLTELYDLLVLSSSLRARKNLRPTIYKAVIILLATKLESFLEELIEEFAFLLNSHKNQNTLVPDVLVINHMSMILREVTLVQTLSGTKVHDICNQISTFKNDPNPQINIDVKFNYGKHGSKEVKKLFSKIGIENIFDVFFPINLDSREAIDIAADIDSLTAIRNNIIHSSANPTISVKQLKTYMSNLENWAEFLVIHLNDQLSEILNV